MLIILGGLPGTGKTTIAKELAKKINTTYIRIDSIEQTLIDSNLVTKSNIDASGYIIAYKIAADNLKCGLNVIADCVNPIEETRNAWRKEALLSKNRYAEIEFICSDKIIHQQRVEKRQADIINFILPTWNEVLQKDFEPWKTEHLIIDTFKKSIKENINTIEDYISKQNGSQ